MTRTPATRWRQALPALALLGVAGLALGACSSSSSSSGASGNSSGTTSSSASTASGSTSAYIQALQQRASSASHATFKASYSVMQTSGTSMTLTFAQMGSKSAFSTGTTGVYTDGSTTTICNAQGGSTDCTQTTGTGANPLSSLLGAISPSGVSSALATAAAAAAGVSVSKTSETHGGQSSSCISGSRLGVSFKYCVADSSGIVTYIAAPSGTFELTSFTSNVSDSDVSPPAGATIVTTPAIP